NVCTGRCLDCRAASMVRKAASAKVGSVVGVSAHVLEAHARDGYFPHASRAVVFNGLPLAGGADRSRPAQGPFHVGFIGRVEEAKGVEVLLQAVERLPDVDLVVKIAGKADPAYLSSLRHRYPDPRVRYVGYVDAPDFYRGL